MVRVVSTSFLSGEQRRAHHVNGDGVAYESPLSSIPCTQLYGKKSLGLADELPTMSVEWPEGYDIMEDDDDESC